MTSDTCKSRSPFIMTVCCSSQRFFVSGQFAVAELIPIKTTNKAATKPTDQTIHLFLQMSGNVHPKSGPATRYPYPVCTRNVTNRGVSYQCNICYGWVHARCSRLLNAAQYGRSSDWACDPCSIPSPPPTYTPSSDQTSDYSTFNVLQLNANGIGNKHTGVKAHIKIQEPLYPELPNSA